jgi:vitamin B12/bleomycin/antimicrobial peptide transport system ATP-binding/permease protein
VKKANMEGGKTKFSYSSFWRLLGPYWWSEERWIGRGLLAIIVALNLGLVRVRENAEGIALYRGESSEQENLNAGFRRILRNWWELMKFQKRLTWFTASYSQLAIIFPILVAAPRFFSGAIQLGGLMQIASAFGHVQSALSWFIDNYRSFAEWKASVDRLTGFHDAIFEVQDRATGNGGILVSSNHSPDLALEDLHLSLPDGRILFDGLTARIAPGERLLIRGPSGAGKSTLFRSIAGIWPFGSGTVRVPSTPKRLFLPQKPYLPIGTLREAVSYPEKAGSFSDSDIVETLKLCRLEEFAGRLDEIAHWEQV